MTILPLDLVFITLNSESVILNLVQNLSNISSFSIWQTIYFEIDPLNESSAREDVISYFCMFC
jgi:hypothetical protein